MKKPDHLEEKEFVLRRITNVRLWYRMTSADTADNFVELTDMQGQKMDMDVGVFADIAEFERYPIGDLVKPKWGIDKEVKEWRAYAKKEAHDLAEYERLKAKFEDA